MIALTLSSSWTLLLMFRHVSSSAYSTSLLVFLTGMSDVAKSQTELLIPPPPSIFTAVFSSSVNRKLHPFIAQARAGSEFGTIMTLLSLTPLMIISHQISLTPSSEYIQSGLCICLPLAPPFPAAWWKSVLTDLHVSFLSCCDQFFTE